jgi:hypothetical protein
MGRDCKYFPAQGIRAGSELEVDENYQTKLLELLDRIKQETPQKVEDAFAGNS